MTNYYDLIRSWNTSAGILEYSSCETATGDLIAEMDQLVPFTHARNQKKYETTVALEPNGHVYETLSSSGLNSSKQPEFWLVTLKQTTSLRISKEADLQNNN